MKNVTKKLDLSLRFIGVSLADIQPFLDEFPSGMVGVRPYHKDKSTLVVVLDLKESLDYEFLAKCINEKARSLDYDIFISVTSESDSDIINIPDYVVGLVRVTNSRLTFSFTVV